MTVASATMKPAMGPEAPITMSAARERTTDFRRITAPKVPLSDGAGSR